MKKLSILLTLLLTFLTITSVAFAENQTFSYSETFSEGLILDQEQIIMNDIDYSSNFATDYLFLLATTNGVYRGVEEYEDIVTFNNDLSGKNVAKIYLSPNNANDQSAMALTTDGELYLTNDNGETWDRAFSQYSNVTDFAYSYTFQTDRTLYIVNDNIIYFSYNGGTDFYDMSDLGLTTITDFEPSQDLSTNRSLFIIADGILYKSIDSGDTIFELDSIENPTQLYSLPNAGTKNPLLVLTEEGELYVSPDEDETFLHISDDIDPITYVSWSPNYATYPTLYVSTADKIYFSFNNGSEWFEAESPGANLQFIEYTPIYQTFQVIFAAVDNILYRTIDGGFEWEEYMYGLEDGAVSYETEKVVESNTLNDALTDNIVSATLTVEEDTPENTNITYQLSTDSENFEDVTPGEELTFTNPGINLRYKITLSTTDTSITPTVSSVSIDYTTEETPGEEGEGEGEGEGEVVPMCMGFEDVDADEDICEIITYVVNEEIFQGYPDYTFGPYLDINRAETVKVVTLANALNILEDDGTDLGFSDVEIGAWYMKYLKTALENAIIEGYPDGTFQPIKTVNKVEMLKIFFLGAGVDFSDYEVTENPFPDTEIDAWYINYVDFAKKNNLIDPDENGNLNPAEAMDRIDVADLFYRYSQI